MVMIVCVRLSTAAGRAAVGSGNSAVEVATASATSSAGHSPSSTRKRSVFHRAICAAVRMCVSGAPATSSASAHCGGRGAPPPSV